MTGLQTYLPIIAAFLAGFSVAFLQLSAKAQKNRQKLLWSLVLLPFAAAMVLSVALWWPSIGAAILMTIGLWIAGVVVGLGSWIVKVAISRMKIKPRTT